MKECVFDVKSKEELIKPGDRKGRPTIFMRLNEAKKLPKGVIPVEKFRKKEEVRKQKQE